MRRHIAIAVARIRSERVLCALTPLFVAGFVVAGCATDANTFAPSQQNTPPSNTSTTTPGKSSQHATVHYGVESRDPIATTVAAPVPFTMSNTAFPQRLAGQPAFKVEVTFRNTTDKPFNPAVLQFQATTNQEVTTSVQDSANITPGVLMIGTIPPDATGSGWIGFAGAPNQTTRIIVSSALGGTSTTFTHPE